jgi:hypothetical protein
MSRPTIRSNCWGERQVVDVADAEGYLGEAGGLRARLRKREDAGVDIHAQDATGRAHHLGGKQAHRARTTAHVQHGHPRLQASRGGIEELSLR